MKQQKFFVFFLSLIIFVSSCTSIPVEISILKSKKIGNTVYVDNSDDKGNIIGIDDITINNITFFSVEYIIYGMKTIDDIPYEIYKGKIDIRSKESLVLSENIKNTINQYKYFCIQFPNGTLKKCSAYTEDKNLFIDIEQFGIEPNNNENEIDPKIFIELEKKFNENT